MENFNIFVQANSDYQIREEMYEGRRHWVVPVTMMVEGVHAGNRGPLLHLADELGSVLEAWDGRPVTMQHPENAEGEYVSANSPEVIAKYAVGRIFHTRLDGSSLRAEAWLDEARLAETSQIAYEAIQNGEPLEVSLGMFSDEEETTGTHNGETYNAIARNPRPDHLALLPGEVGACSWDDGCGIRTNKEGGKNEPMKRQDSLKTVKKAWMEGEFAKLIANADVGMSELISNIQSKLDAMDTDLRTHYYQEVYDDYFVYAVRPREGGVPKLYKRNYSVNDAGVVEFATEEPAEVRKKVSYVTLKEGDIVLTRDNFSSINNKKEVNKMSENKPCCEPLVNALIANAKTKFTEDDRERLLALKEDEIIQLITDEVKEKTPPKKEETVPAQINAEQARAIVKDSIKNTEDFLEIVPDELKEQMQSGLKLHKEQKADMVKTIIANTDEGLWTEDTLNGFDMETLEKVYKTIPAKLEVVDYTVHGAGGGGNETKIKPMLPPGVKLKEAEGGTK